jgi:hypothetical protein
MCSPATLYNTFIKKSVNTVSSANKSGGAHQINGTPPTAYLCSQVQGAEFVGYDMDSILHCMFVRFSYAGQGEG